MHPIYGKFAEVRRVCGKCGRYIKYSEGANDYIQMWVGGFMVPGLHTLVGLAFVLERLVAFSCEDVARKLKLKGPPGLNRGSGHGIRRYCQRAPRRLGYCNRGDQFAGSSEKLLANPAPAFASLNRKA